MFLLGLLWLSGCSPALDWRTVRVPGTELVVQLPCRPGHFQRELIVAGMPSQLSMLSCEAAGVTYGVSTAEVGDPTRVEAVLGSLAEGAEIAIRSRDMHVGRFALAGATPFRGNVSARLIGSRPDGRPIEESMRVFGRGTRVFLAGAIGPALPDSAVTPFEEGLRFDLGHPAADSE
ncbi:MAG: hypothetical protein ABW032_08825 [Burkholderiaceae bacterium]